MSYDFSELSVFVIHENRFTQDLVASLLRCLDISRIKTFDDVAGAISGGAETTAPDVMIVDHMLNDAGRDAVTRIRRHRSESFAFAPVIVLTADTEEWRVFAMRDAGATEIVALPVSARTLYRTLVNIVEAPRPFVRANAYFGPDRRRRDRPFEGGERRGEHDGPVEIPDW